MEKSYILTVISNITYQGTCVTPCSLTCPCALVRYDKGPTLRVKVTELLRLPLVEDGQRAATSDGEATLVVKQSRQVRVGNQPVS